MSNPDDPRAWVVKAEHDLLCIRNNLNDREVPWDIVCFHAQQAAEKMLKAFLVMRGVLVPRIHDLGPLLAEALDAGGPFQHLDQDCALLNPYSVAFRYPGTPVEPDEAQGRAAVAAAQRVCDCVKASLR